MPDELVTKLIQTLSAIPAARDRQETIDALAAAFFSDKEPVQRQAGFALAEISERGADALLAALVTLLTLGKPERVPRKAIFLEFLLYPEEWSVRRAWPVENGKDRFVKAHAALQAAASRASSSDLDRFAGALL